ncbi:DUF421 domain-containing protein [Mesobacillus foraminis]|uniref:DUF421 domain-containing protein n=1 Tax=Mesobacillus foraminis TaxID=279826 RepID=UPI000EF4B544|nr:DUF421 domain-containing protein [Mesobacillus foraminis]
MYGTIALKLIIGLIALLVVIRLLGKKELAQITPFDFIYALVLGGFLEEAIFDEKVSIGHLTFSIALWAILIYGIEVIVMKFDKLRPLLKGEPITIIEDGKLDLKALKKAKLEMEQLRTMLRQQGIFSIKEVSYAILEPSGHLSIMPEPFAAPVTAEMLDLNPKKSTPSIMLIDEGREIESGLRLLGKDKKWLRDLLQKHGESKISDIFYAEWSSQYGFLFKKFN